MISIPASESGPINLSEAIACSGLALEKTVTLLTTLWDTLDQ
jgi:hypothetical protein